MGRAAVTGWAVVLALPAAAVPLNAPTVSGGGASWSAAASLAFGASGGGGDAVAYEYRTSTDGGATWSGVSAGGALSVSAQGETQVQFRAVDALGNRSAWAGAPSPEGLARLDRTVPTTPAQPAGASPSSAASLTWTPGGDSGGSGLAGYRVLRDGTQIGTTAFPSYIDGGAPDGAHLYRVVAYDGAGNVSLQSPGRTIVSDATPPTPPNVSGAQPAPANVTDVTLVAAGSTDATAGIAGYERRTSANGGTSWTAAAPGSSAVVTAEGKTLVQFRAVDLVGNRTAWTPAAGDPAGLAWIDRTPPPRPSAPTGSGWPLAVSWEPVTDAVSYVVRRDGVSLGSTAGTALTDAGATDDAAPDAPSRLIVTVPSRGVLHAEWTASADRGTDHAFTVRASDAAGNAGEASAAATLTAKSGLDRYVVRMDGQVVGTTTGTSFDIPGLDPTVTRTITIVAVDAAGNTSAPADPSAVMPEPGPPPVLALSASRVMMKPGGTAEVTAKVTGIAVSPVEWREDGRVVASGARFTRRYTTPGTHRVTATVVARDGSLVTQDLDVVVDQKPPDLTLMVRRNRLRASARDAETGVQEVRLIRGPKAPQAIGAGGITLPDGRYAVIVRAVDLVGNSTDVGDDVLIDGTPPVLRVTAPGVATPGRVVAAITVRDGLSGVRRLTIDGKELGKGVTAAALSAGSRHRLVAEDVSGNRATLVIRIAELPALPRQHPSLDGALGDQLRYDPGGRVQKGVRGAILRGVQTQMIAVQALPPSWRITDRFTVRLLRAVQRYQRRLHIPPNGTLGPRTRTALDRDARRNRVTEAH
ncbi:MAG: hypothetical protein IT200_05810 [Thermoleophilia bacterium]|nr:hypothetical protein [Thermoleophilia bacterium]